MVALKVQKELSFVRGKNSGTPQIFLNGHLQHNWPSLKKNLLWGYQIVTMTTCAVPIQYLIPELECFVSLAHT